MASSSSPPNDDPLWHFESHPSDQTLLQSHLRPWVETSRLNDDGAAFIHEVDVYSDEPDILTTQFPPAVAQDGERAWYFLTPLQSKSKVRGKRKNRIVANGEGCWHSEAKPKPVVDNLDAQVGYRQSFTFMKDVGGVRTRTGWLMLELGLGSNQDQGDASAERIVLCKVYRSPRYPGERAAKASPRADLKREADDGENNASPPPQRKTDDDDDEEGSDASQASDEGRRKSDGEGSSAATVAEPRKADDKIPETATAAPGRKEKDDDEEGSAETFEAATGTKRKAADEDSSVAPSAMEPARSKRRIDDGGAELHCPQCGCHLDAEALLAAANSKPDTESEKGMVHVAEDSSVKKHSYYKFI